MSFNKFKKRKNNFNNLIKHLLFGKGILNKKILFGKARGIRMNIDPAYNFQRIIGVYEFEIQSLFIHFTKKSNYFFDIGAFDGYYSLIYKKYNPDGEAYLFELDKNLEPIQKTHFALNDITDGFHLCFKSVSDKNDELQISPDSFGIKDSKVLIKVDVEGAEAIVLNGMSDLLKKNECRLIIETHSVQLEKHCIDFLGRHGYYTRIIKNAWWRRILPERRPLEHNRWLAAWKQNMENEQ